MAKDLFSVTIFFVVFRESLEAALIVSVLLSLVDQILLTDPSLLSTTTDPESTPTIITPKGLKKLRLQVIFGALVGLLIAVSIGGAFIAIWFTQAKNLWAHSEQLWEGIFELVACLMIFAMGVTMLKMENSRTKWRIKLQNAFNTEESGKRGSKSGKWVLFILPMITVLREGLEAVVFVGGVALAAPATSIPIAAIIGIIGGLVCGFLIYQFGSRSTFRIFLICMTNLLLLIGAGLFSRAVWAFQEHAFTQLIGASSDDAGGTGPGSYDVRGNVWHLDCCGTDLSSWSIFNAVLGWQNSATLGSVLAYVFYWLAVIATLVYYKYKEGRTKLFGWESAKGKQRRERREAQEIQATAVNTILEKDSQTKTSAIDLMDSMIKS